MNGRWIDQFPPEREYDLEIDEDTYELQMADAAAAQAAANSAAESARRAEEIAQGLREEIPTKVSELENDSNYAVDANYVHTDNNFTSSEKNKLEGIAAGAEVNVNADWNATSGDAVILNKPTIPSKVSDLIDDSGHYTKPTNGIPASDLEETYLTEHQDISGKADKSEIPTAVSQLDNDAGYITGYTETDPTVPAWAKASTKPSYTASEVGAPTVQEMNTAINNAIGSVNSFDVAVVQALPNENISTHTIYLVPKTGETNDVYDEYIYINNAWEMVGNTQIDLSDYATKSEIPDVPVDDVQINGTSIVQGDVANVPVANSTTLGVVAINDTYGININPSTGALKIQQASSSEIRDGVANYKPITTIRQHEASFYGLAKAAGDTTQAQSENAVGTYTDDAKAAIQTMLNVPDKNDVLEDFSDLQNDVNSKATAIYETVGPASVVSFTDGADNAPIELLTVDLCDQDLHGYDHPWAAGHGINMLPPVCNNGDFTLDENGAYSQNNTSSAGWSWTYSRNVVNVTVQPGTYTVSFHAVTIADGSAAELRVFTSTGSQLKTISGSNKQSGSATFTVDAETTIGICIKCYKGVWKLQLEEGSTASDWTPYENVCPMAGNTSIDISVSGADTTTPTVTHITFVDPETEDPITVYGGMLAIDSDGTRHIDICQYYESYSGETLVGPWRSSDEAYDPEATPTVGAQVVDYGSVIKSFSLAGNPIYTLYGENNIWSSVSGNIIVRYLADSELYIEEAIKVKDVQIDGMSIVSDGVANVPFAKNNIANKPGFAGIVGINSNYGIDINNAQPGQYLCLSLPTNLELKNASQAYKAITPYRQHISTFYGLAKIAGYDEKNSTLPVGQYTENAKSAIQSMLGVTDSINNATSMLATVETTTTASKAYAVGDLLVYDGQLYKVTSAITLGSTLIPDGNIEQTTVEQELAVANNDVTDVQIDGTSIVSNGVANIPTASNNTLGLTRASGNGIGLINGYIQISEAPSSQIKLGSSQKAPITVLHQHEATFYGLAKAAGDTTQSQSSNAIGQYTDEARSAIHTMLGIDPASIAAQVEIPLVETISGTTPTITGEPNVRYKCGEVSTITITPPASGSIDVIFDSGSTAAVLTVPNTVRWPEWFDATELETDRTYEILITDGVYGSVMSWAI